jgi:predicted permease
MHTFLQDLRYSLRMLAKSPGFTAVAVLTLALGIGANTAIFSVVDTVLLRPLPFPRSDRLVSVQYFDTINKIAQQSVGFPDFADWRKQNHVFSGITAFHDSSYNLTGLDQPAHLSGEIVSSDFFSTLEVAPQLGRGFLREDEQKGHHVVVLSDELWRTIFAANPDVIGRSITLNSNSYTIAGVAPRGFDFPIATPPVQLWTSSAEDGEMLGERGAHYMSVVARLKPGVSVSEAQADIAHINANLAKQYPGSNLHFGGAHVEPELQYLVGDVQPALLILFAAVGFVLLIACANVANLLLARSMTRQKELAIRSALGAGRFRVIRQLLVESLALALAGAALGLLIAQWGTTAMVSMIPRDIPRMARTQMDSRVFLFTLAAALFTGILFGLAPALHSSKVNLTDALKEAGRGTSEGIQHNRLRGSLVVVEMALALTLLLGAGLMLQSFARLQSVNPGFNPHGLLTFTFALPDARYNTNQQKIFYRQAIEQLGHIPGVVSAAGALPLPLSGNDYDISFTIEGRPVQKGNEPDEDIKVVSPGYFKTMGIPVLEGHEFIDTDKPASPNVLIINQAFAKKYFPNEDPIGKRMNPGLSDSDVPKTPMREIVGVVANVKARKLSSESKPEYYFPYQQALIGNLTMVLRTQAAPESVLGAARDVVHSMDSSLPVYNVKTMDQYLGASIGEPRFSTVLLLVFAGLALTLTALGLYGVISYSVAQRTREIGIRMALGAQLRDVLRMVFREAMLLVVAGWAAGVVVSFLLMQFLESELYGIHATDPLTILAVSIVLAGVALLASYIPARRATRVDPIVALRYE